MLVWLLMLGSIIAIWFILPDALGEKKKKLIFLGFAFGILVFVLGSRSDLSASSGDIVGYVKWYRRAIALPLDELLDTHSMEHGYLILNDILAWLVPWDRFILYFQAAFCNGVILWYLYRNVDNIFFAVVVYICVGPWQFFLTAFRQAFAICICLVALELLKKRRFLYDIMGLIAIALAATIHTTAWVFVVVFIIRQFRVGKGFFIFCLMSALVILLFIDDIVDFGNDVMGRVYEAGQFRGNAFGGLIPILIYIATLILCYIVWRYDKSFVEEYSFEIKLLTFGLCLYALRYNTTVLERISFYFSSVIAVLLPAVLGRQKLMSERKIATAISVGLCIALFCYRVTQQYGTYEFYWN